MRSIAPLHLPAGNKTASSKMTFMDKKKDLERKQRPAETLLENFGSSRRHLQQETDQHAQSLASCCSTTSGRLHRLLSTQAPLMRFFTGISLAVDEDGSVRVLRIAEGSPIAASGSIEPGDIVTQVNGECIDLRFLPSIMLSSVLFMHVGACQGLLSTVCHCSIALN
jgi:C-terminal processing protease CtpA/Prc